MFRICAGTDDGSSAAASINPLEHAGIVLEARRETDEEERTRIAFRPRRAPLLRTHTAVMPEAALVVTHGGHGTVMTALMHRLPMLVIPHGRDQADNAARIAERGAGLVLSRTATTDEILTALGRLLEDPAFRAAARQLGDAVAEEAKAATLVEDIEALAAAPGATDRAREPVSALDLH